ncbi:hypothetical protein PM082_014817 [Marasmius tenuissimus]|nr:hypothetical protein PM082_014817 [Marasmius tenuissimus]
MDLPEMDLGDNTSDLRLHNVKPDCRDPEELSHSDFVYAVAPVFSSLMEQTDDMNKHEECCELKRFSSEVWEAWSSVWRSSKIGQKELMRDIRAEFRLHVYHITHGYKDYVFEGLTARWDDILRHAVIESRFERWADPDFLASIWPPAPPPSPAYVSKSWEESLAEMNEEWGRFAEERNAREVRQAEAETEGVDYSWNH